MAYKFTIEIDTKTGQVNVKELADKLKGIKTATKENETATKEWVSSYSNIAIGLNQGLELLKKGFDFLSTPLKSAGQFEAYETTLKVMLGTTEKAKQRLQEYVEFAKTTPFELPAVVEAGNKLQAIGKYSIDNMKMLGDLAAAAGKPYEQVLSAYSKLATGQKGIAVDMFRDLLITSTDWEKATGKGKKASGEMIASADEMLAALPNIVKAKNFSGMMDEQSKTMLGQFSNMQDAIGQFATAIGNELMGMAKGAMTVITPVFSFLQQNIKDIIPIIGVAAGAFVVYQGAVSLASLATVVMDGALKKLWISMLANPVGLVVVGITALAVASKYLLDETEKTAESMKKEAIASTNLLDSQIQLTKSRIREKESAISLMDEYTKLSNKVNKTAEDKKKLSTITQQLNEKYPGIIKNTGDLTTNMVSLGVQTDTTKKELSELNTEFDRLGKARLKANINLANIDVNVAKESLEKSLYDVMGSWHGGTKYKQAAYNFANDFAQNIYNLKDEGAILDALDAFNQKIIASSKQGMELEGISAEQTAAIYSNAEKMAKNKIKANKLYASEGVDLDEKARLEEEEKKRKAEEDAAKKAAAAGKKTKEKTLEQILKDQMDLAKAKLDAEKISNDEYLKEIAGVYDQLYYDKKYIELQAKEKAGKLKGDEVKELTGLTKIEAEIHKITNPDMKSVEEHNSKMLDNYYKYMSDLNKIKADELKNSLDFSQLQFKSGKIEKPAFIESLNNVMKTAYNEISKGGKDVAELLKRMQEGTLTNDFVKTIADNIEKSNPGLKTQLSEYVKIYQDASKEEEEVRKQVSEKQKLYNDLTLRGMETLQDGLNMVISSGFGKEGFKKAGESLASGLKSILSLLLDYAEKVLIIGDATSIIKAFASGGTSLIQDIPLKIAAEAAIILARSSINSWTPHFATGGAVTGPTYLLAGEMNRKEYIIPENTMRQEIRNIFREERQRYAYVGNNSMQLDINISGKLIGDGKSVAAVVNNYNRMESKLNM